MEDGMTPREFERAEGTEDWRVVGDGVTAFFPATSFEESVAFVQAISELPAVVAHQPDVDIRKDGVTCRLVTVADDYFGPTQRDAEAAREISAAARKLGLRADPSAVQSVLVIPGAPVPGEVMPFWRAVLGYVPRPDSPDEDLVDPHDRGPALWFERMDQPRPGGGGAIHVAVWVPYEEARTRIDAALAAGGRIVRDQFAPAWWTLADAAGNEVDISTIAGRA